MKFGFDWSSGFREDLWNGGHIRVYSPGAGADNPLESNIFQQLYYSVNLVLCYKIFSLKDFLTVFPIQT